MADDLWDLAVVGAGPAGAAAALGALRRRPDARVLLLDPADFPRDKSCGDGIAPQALDVLRSLGVHGVTEGFRPVSRLSIGYPDGDWASGTMHRPAQVVPRRVLDARLVHAATGAGAVLARHTVRNLERRHDSVVLDGVIRARTVVAADGADSVVRRRLGLVRNAPRHLAIALRGYAPVLPDLADEQRIAFARAGWPAYAWSFPVGDGSANVGYGEVLRSDRRLTRAYLLERLEALLPGAAEGGSRWRAHHLPLSSQRPRQPDGRVLLVGDALSLVNPITGEGIFYAVLSGACAGAAAVRPGDAGATYRRLLQHRLGRHLRHTTAAAGLARVPGLVEGAVRAARHPGVFDDVVELGLGRGLLTPRMLASTAVQLRRRPQRLRGSGTRSG